LVGSNFLSLIPESDQKTVRIIYRALTSDAPTQSHEHAVITPKGDVRWQRWINRAIIDVRGKIVEYQSLGEDISEVNVPRENLVKELHGGAICLNQMMITERLTSAAGCLGVWGALDLAVRYSNKRRTFGKKIRNYQAVNFKIADSITQLDAARGLCYMAAQAVDEKYTNVRRIVSEANRFATETSWDIVNKAMQVMGGIGYTDVYPIEREL